MRHCEMWTAGAGDGHRQAAQVSGTGRRHELTDAAWAVVAPLLPVTPKADRLKRRDQVRHRSSRRRRKPIFDRVTYRARSIVECVIGWHKRLRRVATRAEKLAIRYGGMISWRLSPEPPMFHQTLPRRIC